MLWRDVLTSLAYYTNGDVKKSFIKNINKFSPPEKESNTNWQKGLHGIPLKEFDSENQYNYLHSRLRKLEDSDIPIRIRGASNPGGISHDWVKKKICRWWQ